MYNAPVTMTLKPVNSNKSTHHKIIKIDSLEMTISTIIGERKKLTLRSPTTESKKRNTRGEDSAIALKNNRGSMEVKSLEAL